MAGRAGDISGQKGEVLLVLVIGAWIFPSSVQVEINLG